MNLSWFLIVAFFVTTALFFWSVYKALKSRRAVYMWGMVPFFAYIVGIFFV